MSLQKIIFVDFDNTLFIHDHTLPPLSFMQEFIKKDFFYYKAGYFNHLLIDTLIKEKEDGATLILLSQANNSLEIEAKKKEVEDKYPNLFYDFIGASSVENKIEIMKEYEDYYGISRRNIMLVDDRTGTLMLARKEGFKIRTPLEGMYSRLWK